MLVEVRVFTIVAEQLAGTIDVVQWMPTHADEEAIGRKECNNGSVIIDKMCRSNQVVDLVAKHAAESVSLRKQDRCWLVHRERQVREFYVFLERLTHVANNHALPDGKVVRDSDGTWRKRSKPGKLRVVQLAGALVRPADPVSQVAQLWTSHRRPALGNPPSKWMGSWGGQLLPGQAELQRQFGAVYGKASVCESDCCARSCLRGMVA